MNKVFLAVGILSASVALGQTNRATTTRSSSTTTSTSNYNNSNTGNYNSSNATMGTSMSGSMGTSGSMNSGTTGTNAPATGSATGSYDDGTRSMGSTTSGTYSNTNPSGSMSTGSTGTTNSMNNNTGTYNNSTTTTPSGNINYNTMGTTGSATTPSASGGYNSNNNMNGTTGTSSYSTSSTYSTENSAASRRNGVSDDPAGANGYNNFVFGIYGGLNSTRFRGESIDADNPAARLGYQLGLFLRGGGRLFGQVGAEYFASSSNYYRAGVGSSTAAIRDYIDIQYIQIPVYVGYKIVDSPRGNSSIRVQAGVAYANRINSNSNSFKLSNDEIRSGSFNALGQVGFDFGPFLVDLTYQHGLSDAIRVTNFAGSQRRILTASVGFKF